MEEMNMTLEELKAMVKEVVADEISPVKEAQSAYIGQLAGAISKASTQGQENKVKGINSTRMLNALSLTKGDKDKALVMFQKEFPDEGEYFEKALAAQSSAGGGFLIREDFDDGIIELLRPASVVRSLNPLMVGLDSGTLNIPKHTAGSSGGWIGENSNITKTEPTFGQVTLQAHKYASLVPVSNDLIRRSNYNTQTIVRDDLVADISTATDLAFIRSDGTAGQPRGLRYLAGNTLTANATVSVANVVTDLGKMIQYLLDDNVRMLRPGWMFSPRTWRYLYTVLDGNGNFIFKGELDKGTLFGFPYRMTTNIPSNLGTGSNESEVYLCDFADVVVGEATSIMIDVSDSAAYHDGSNVVASFSLDQSVIRAIVEVDINTRHDVAVGVITGVKWGV
jgi:HK97 family phage major capsid protein